MTSIDNKQQAFAQTGPITQQLARIQVDAKLDHERDDIAKRLRGSGFKVIEEYNDKEQRLKVSGEYPPQKTMWDWSQLLIIPFVLALVTIGFGLGQYVNSQWLANDQQQQTILDNYLDRMSDLLLNTTSTTTLLHKSTHLDEVRKVARARTLIALSRLDPERKRAVILFLYNADLITWHSWPNFPGVDFPIVNLDGADLSHADLSGIFLNNADLHGTLLEGALLSNTNLDIANLEGADLSGADLSGTYLEGTNLYKAGLQGTNFTGAHLQMYTAQLPPDASRQTNLSEAILRGANLTGVNLSQVFMKGAIMPDGRIHP